MRIRAYTYSIPFRRPMRFGAVVMNRRRGMVIRMDHQGAEGWGECAPLDGYSQNGFDEARAHLPGVLAKLAGYDPAHLPQIPADVHADGFPEIQAGITGAAEDLFETGDADGEWRTETASLIYGRDPVDAEADAANALASGYEVLKLKVGGRSLDEDAELVRVVASLPGLRELRLDANRAWRLEDALRFSEIAMHDKISFIEEPLRDVADYPAYNEGSGMPFAVDESLADGVFPDGLPSLRRLTALVIKPGRLGGRESAMRLASEAAERGLRCVLSGMYESGIGTRSLIRMAASSPFRYSAAGLDTFSALDGDITGPPPEIGGGAITAARRFIIDYTKLDLFYDSDSMPS